MQTLMKNCTHQKTDKVAPNPVPGLRRDSRDEVDESGEQPLGHLGVSVGVGGGSTVPTLSLPSLTNTSDIKKLSQSTLSRVSKWHVML